jgi:hypothetical protein
MSTSYVVRDRLELTEVEEGNRSTYNDRAVLEELRRKEGFGCQLLGVLPNWEYEQQHSSND